MTRLLSFLSAICLLLLFSPLYSQCGAFSDGFESGNWTPTWTHVSGTYTRTVTTTNPAVGNYCLSQSGSGSHASGLVAVFPSAQPNNISWRVRYDATSNSGGYFICGDSSTTANNCVTFCYISGGANVRFYNGTGVNTPCVANTWYQIELRNINWVSRTYDFYINGNLIQSGYSFRTSTMTDMDRIYLYNISSMTAYYDEILVDGASIALNPVVSDPNCAGDSTGSVSLAPTGGTPVYNYVWSTGDTTSTVSNLGAGTYAVTVTDSAGCVGSDSITVTEPSAVGGSFVQIDPICPGDSTGLINLSPTGGTPPYAFSWSSGDTTEDLSNLPADDYVVTISDSLGCTHLDTVQISEPPAITATFSIADVLCNGDTNGAIIFTPSGGTPGYSFLWNTGETSRSLSGLSGGWYPVTITDTLGCTHTDSAEVGEPAAIASSGVITDETTPPGNNGSIDLTVSGGTPGFSFSWSNGDNTEDVSGLAAGTYSVVITDDNGCTSADTFEVVSIVGLADAFTDFGISAYPNPGKGVFQVEMNLPVAMQVNFTLMSLQGKVLRNWNLQLQSGENAFPIDLEKEISGIYLLQVQTEAGRDYLKLIKQ